MDQNKIQRILIKKILNERIDYKNIVGIYNYGSLLYGTDNKSSDLDYCIVLKNGTSVLYDEGYIQIESDDLDLHIMSESHYKELLEKHDIMAMEMFYQKDPVLKYEIDFALDLQKLRRSISSIVNNSWVKAKKKMEIPEEDSYIGLKSLFHSFRILDFGIGIAKYNSINYTAERLFWLDLLEQWEINKDWNFYYDKYKKVHNSLNSEFKKVAPKVTKG